MNLSRNALRRAALVLLPALVVGCASFSSTPEQAVEKRAAEYWQARQKGDVQRAYDLSTPAYRKLRTLDQFRMLFGPSVSIVSSEVANVACEPTKCIAKMKIGVKPALVGVKLGTVPMYIDETWLLEDGQWWHFQEL